MKFKTGSILDDFGVFVQLYDAQENPRAPGEFITPDRFTDSVPDIPPREGWGRRFVGPGWEYVLVQETPEGVPVPVTSCYPVDGFIALFSLYGVTRDDVVAALGKIEDATERYRTQMALEYSPWVRTSPVVSRLAEVLELDDAQIDAIFQDPA